MDAITIKANLDDIRGTIEASSKSAGRDPKDITLIAVTKLHGPEEINAAIDCGVTDIGENKVQEILEKYDKVKPVRWHLIGHLQTNKVKYIIDKVELIHSVDSLRLAQEIDKRAGQHGKTMDVLIQVNAAEEESKFGVSTEETERLIQDIVESCPNVKIKGLMCIAPLEEDIEAARPFFAEVKRIFDRYAGDDSGKTDFRYLSMGMTNDYTVAIEEGANMVRIGRAIFGARNYRQEEK